MSNPATTADSVRHLLTKLLTLASQVGALLLVPFSLIVLPPVLAPSLKLDQWWINGIASAATILAMVCVIQFIKEAFCLLNAWLVRYGHHRQRP